jgi:hypothetical protein
MPQAILASSHPLPLWGSLKPQDLLCKKEIQEPQLPWLKDFKPLFLECKKKKNNKGTRVPAAKVVPTEETVSFLPLMKWHKYVLLCIRGW